jgi:hypothetical protein
MFETLLIKAIRGFLSYFSNPVSELPLTYHRELIDDDSASGAKRLHPPLQFYTMHKPIP